MQDITASLRFGRAKPAAVLGFAIILFGLGGVFAHAQSVASAPRADKLEAGDLIWPKKPGTIVPYNSQPGSADKGEAERWKRERDAYLEELLAKPKSERTKEDRERYSALQDMTYRQFRAIYFDDSTLGEAAGLGSPGLSVGHVGIIEVVNGQRNVIEAMVKPGVRRISYDEWLQERLGEEIWVGRLIGVSPKKRAAVATVAASYIKRPYNFWNFNLEDTSGFYCSKLGWLAIREGAGFAPDNKDYPRRPLWFSPKQLMHSPRVKLIVNPGSYGRSR